MSGPVQDDLVKNARDAASTMRAYEPRELIESLCDRIEQLMAMIAVRDMWLKQSRAEVERLTARLECAEREVDTARYERSIAVKNCDAAWAKEEVYQAEIDRLLKRIEAEKRVSDSLRFALKHPRDQGDPIAEDALSTEATDGGTE